MGVVTRNTKSPKKSKNICSSKFNALCIEELNQCGAEYFSSLENF